MTGFASWLNFIFGFSEKLLSKYSELVEFFSHSLSDFLSPSMQEIFDTYYWIFDIPNKLLHSALGLPPFYEMTIFELLSEAVIFIVIYTIITWILDII